MLLGVTMREFSNQQQDGEKGGGGGLMGLTGQLIIWPTPSRDGSMLDLRWRIWVLILTSKAFPSPREVVF